MHERGSKLLQGGKAQVRIANRGGPVLIAIDVSWRQNGKAIVGGCHAGCLHGPTHDVIDERALAGRMIAHEQDEWQRRALMRRGCERSPNLNTKRVRACKKTTRIETMGIPSLQTSSSTKNVIVGLRERADVNERTRSLRSIMERCNS
jgi:hypothetical protein